MKVLVILILSGMVTGAFNSATVESVFGFAMSDPVNISNTPTQTSQRASISVDGEGSINVAWQETWIQEIRFSRSNDEGDIFIAPIVVMPNVPRYSYGDNDIVATGKGIHITFVVFDKIFGGAENAYSRSTDGGETFSYPIIVSNVDLINSYGPSIAADGNNRIGIVWTDSDLIGTSGSSIFYCGSVDNGDTFSTPMILVGNAPVSGPDIAISSGNIYVVWSAGEHGIQEGIFFSRSLDGGVTFSEPNIISNFSDYSGVSNIAVDSSGNIYVVWEEGNIGLKNKKILFVRSIDAGNSFSSPAILEGVAGNACCSSIALVNGRIYISWSTTDDGYQTFQNYLVWSLNGGATFSNPFKIPLEPEAGGPEIVAIEHYEFGLLYGVSRDLFFSKVNGLIPRSKAMPWLPLLLFNE